MTNVGVQNNRYFFKNREVGCEMTEIRIEFF